MVFVTKHEAWQIEFLGLEHQESLEYYVNHVGGECGRIMIAVGG